MGDGEEGEAKNEANLIPRCQSRSKAPGAERCEQQRFERAIVFQQMRRELLSMA